MCKSVQKKHHLALAVFWAQLLRVMQALKLQRFENLATPYPPPEFGR